MKKKIGIISIVAVVLIVCIVAAVLVLGNKNSIATVNGEKITEKDFAMYQLTVEYSMMSQAGISSQDQANAFWTTTEIEGKSAGTIAKERAMEQAVLVTVLCQKAKDMGIVLTDEEKVQITQQIESDIADIGGREKFEERLEEIGTDMDSYKKFMESELVVRKFHEVINTLPEYSVTEEQAKELIKNTYIKAKHILLTTVDELNLPYTDEEKLAVKAQIDDLYQKIKNGADFDELMVAYSQDPGLMTSPDGYVFGKGQMVAEFENAAYALEIGEVSEPVETSYGYHIIKREEVTITDEDVASYLETEMQILKNQKLTGAYEEWRGAADIKIDQGKLVEIPLATMRAGL